MERVPKHRVNLTTESLQDLLDGKHIIQELRDGSVLRLAKLDRVTLSQALDYVDRAINVIEESEGADEHHELLQELRSLHSDLADGSMTTGEYLLTNHDK